MVLKLRSLSISQPMLNRLQTKRFNISDNKSGKQTTSSLFYSWQIKIDFVLSLVAVEGDSK